MSLRNVGNHDRNIQEYLNCHHHKQQQQQQEQQQEQKQQQLCGNSTVSYTSYGGSIIQGQQLVRSNKSINKLLRNYV